MWFASLRLTYANEEPAPVLPASCVEHFPDISSGLIVFDTLIHNEDRHEHNLALGDEKSGAGIKIFDHDAALLGQRSDNGIAHLRRKTENSLERHFLISEIVTDRHLPHWFDRVAKLPDFYIDQACQHVVGHGINEKEAGAVSRFLKHRRDHIKSLTLDPKSRYENVTQWSLDL